MKKLLITLFLFLGAFVFSQNTDQEKPLNFSTDYKGTPHFATTLLSIERGYEGTITLLLSDGSHWNTSTDFWEILEGWQIGDEIRWKENSDSKTYLLKDIRSCTTLLAELNFFATPAHSYIIEEIDQNGYLILTDTGHQWAIGYWGALTTRKWNKGDRLIINKSGYSEEEDYCLINLNMKNDVWASLIYWK